jgi:hypothetical protein
LPASDAQVQAWSDQRTRPRAEMIRTLYNLLVSDINSIEDVYQACAQQSPTWADARTDGPPHLLGPSDVLAMNSLTHAIKDAIDNSGQWAVAQKACVRAPGA